MSETHSTGNLNLVVDATPVRVITGLGFTPSLLPREVNHSRLRIRIIILRLLGFRDIIDRRRDLAHPFTSVPHLEDNIEDLSINLPRS